MAETVSWPIMYHSIQMHSVNLKTFHDIFIILLSINHVFIGILNNSYGKTTHYFARNLFSNWYISTDKFHEIEGLQFFVFNSVDLINIQTLLYTGNWYTPFLQLCEACVNILHCKMGNSTIKVRPTMHFLMFFLCSGSS